MTYSSEHPELVNNPTLGAATTNPFLDQVEAQSIEDHNARIEGREARTVIAENRYPQFMPSGSVPSSTKPELSFKDETPVAESEEEVLEQGLFSSSDYGVSDGD